MPSIRFNESRNSSDENVQQLDESRKQNSKSRRRPHLERELFVVALLVFGASFSNIVSQQDAVHFALTWSLVNTHSLWLNSTLYSGQPFVTQGGGHALSALPPGLSFFAFAFVAPAPLILPLEPSVVGVYLATYFSCLVGALATVIFFKTANIFGSTRSALLVTTVFAFGTSMWMYSRIYLPEGLATLLGVASVYYLLQIFRREDSAEDALLTRDNGVKAIISGILLGLMIFVDNMAVFFVVPILFYLTLTKGPAGVRSRFAILITFVAGLVLGSVPVWYYDLITTGNVFTAPYGLPLIGGVQLSSYGYYNLLQGLFLEILSPQSGLLFFTPFVLISAVGFLYFLKQATARESLLFVALFLSILIPFSLQSPSTYLHNTVGPSELVLAIPYVLFLSVSFLDKYRHFSIGGVVAYALASASILINGIIALTDPVNLGLNIGTGSGGDMLSPLLTDNIQLFLGQYYLTWWSFFVHPLLYACATLCLPLTVFLIYLFGRTKLQLGIRNQMIVSRSLTRKQEGREKIEQP